MSFIEVDNIAKYFKVRQKADHNSILSNLLHREYVTKKAVDDISFSIEKGETVGYIGPNGAGKSTTIKMLSGILVPDSGSIVINGFVPSKDRKEYTKNIGVVFGQRTQLWWDIPVSESLDLMKYIYKIPKHIYQENLDMFYDILGIAEFGHIPVRQLSLGQRMRADLCASLLHNPDILFLDEPTIGLDAVVKKSIRDFVKEINEKRNTTIILTTHDMADIEKLCSRVIVIDHGKKLYDGNLEYVKNTFGTAESIEVVLRNNLNCYDWLYEHGVNQITKTENGLTIKYDKRIINSSAIISFLMKDNDIKDFIVHETDIEESIRQMYLAN